MTAAPLLHHAWMRRPELTSSSACYHNSSIMYICSKVWAQFEFEVDSSAASVASQCLPAAQVTAAAASLARAKEACCPRSGARAATPAHAGGVIAWPASGPPSRAATASMRSARCGHAHNVRCNAELSSAAKAWMRRPGAELCIESGALLSLSGAAWCQAVQHGVQPQVQPCAQPACHAEERLCMPGHSLRFLDRMGKSTLPSAGSCNQHPQLLLLLPVH